MAMPANLIFYQYANQQPLPQVPKATTTKQFTFQASEPSVDETNHVPKTLFRRQDCFLEDDDLVYSSSLSHIDDEESTLSFLSTASDCSQDAETRRSTTRRSSKRRRTSIINLDSLNLELVDEESTYDDDDLSESTPRRRNAAVFQRTRFSSEPPQVRYYQKPSEAEKVDLFYTAIEFQTMIAHYYLELAQAQFGWEEDDYVV